MKLSKKKMMIALMMTTRSKRTLTVLSFHPKISLDVSFITMTAIAMPPSI